MNIKKIEDGVEKTGFRLEFDISHILTSHGWNVINNKYYVDDQHETVREIDLVAYKASLVQSFHVYTTLIVSCKKNEKDAWVLLSKNPNPKDPNMEWLPVHAWSNDRVLSLMLGEQDWKEMYLSTAKTNGCKIISKMPGRHIFAFQEMNMESGAPKNDTNIFNSVTSLMKAQAYEMNALPLRKKEPCVFQFNLISVMDTELVRMDFTSNAATGTSIDDEVYVAGYIIDKKQTFAKVHFVKAKAFEKKLAEYDAIHVSNADSFGAIYDKFFDQVKDDHKKQDLFKEDLRNDIWWPIYSFLKDKFGVTNNLKDGWLYWNSKANEVEFQIDLGEDLILEMNNNNTIRKSLTKALKKYYRYEGESKFAQDAVPF